MCGNSSPTNGSPISPPRRKTQCLGETCSSTGQPSSKKDQACHPRRQFWRRSGELMGRVSRQPSPRWSTRVRGLPMREVTAGGRTHAKKVKHRHVLPPLLLARVVRHRLVQNARSRSNSETASLHPECKQTFAVHAPMSVHLQTRPDFHVNGWAKGPWKLRTGSRV